jgi:GT2 family glycosyltransferase
VEGARVVVSDVPLGFAGGVNLGARAARGALLHVLHDDTEVLPGRLDTLVACLDAHPHAGAVASVTRDFDGPLQGAGWVLWREARTSAPWTGAPPGPETLGPAFPIDDASSASIMVRRDVWKAIGGLDEDVHPACFVDADLAMAVRRHRRLVLCEPRSQVRHAQNGSKGQAFRQFVSAQCRYLSRRDRRRSLRTLPPVWSAGQ